MVRQINQQVISLKNIAKTINENSIFSLSDLVVNKGDFVTIVGRSGAGKTTLLNILGLNDLPTNGQYFFEEKNIGKLKRRQKLILQREKISFLFQDFGLVEDETIGFNLDIGLKYLKLSKIEKNKRKLEALEDVNLPKKLTTSIYSLSGGEKQRVALARMILKPSVLILADEPTGSLDSVNRDLVTKILLKQAEAGKAVIIVTHDDYLSKKSSHSIKLN
ncbi:ATP-binding cassette domain-containing protein [Carnobacterium maltaromaticum]|uniref:ATP-binding cassette domain-containing protein n=1 Tax=Carnobacterium maltaromaticum TaxID=2751 RepID=UPI0012F8EA74|nr:ATP-binding cassette domain-containing protein [Carnobacterium maltaromaticum]